MRPSGNLCGLRARRCTLARSSRAAPEVAARVVRATRVYDGRVVSLRVDEVVLPSGRSGLREIVEHRGAVAVVPLTANGDVGLVRQFRSATGGGRLESP